MTWVDKFTKAFADYLGLVNFNDWKTDWDFHIGSTYWWTSDAIWEIQFTVVPKKSSQNQRSSARTEEKISNAKVWYRFNGQPKTSAIVFRNGKELLLKSRFLMDHAVIHWTRDGRRSNSSLNRLPKSGMWPPPYRMAILLWPSSIALLRASIAALFLSPMMTELSSTSAVTWVNLYNRWYDQSTNWQDFSPNKTHIAQHICASFLSPAPCPTFSYDDQTLYLIGFCRTVVLQLNFESNITKIFGKNIYFY